MIITIHRGIDKIGGCITGIESKNGTKIIIDLGHNLPDGDKPSIDPLDKPENLDELVNGASAVFYTHPHGDHLGFESKITEKGIPQYIGEVSKEMMLILKDSIIFRAKGEKKEKAKAEYDAIKDFITYKADSPVYIYDKKGNRDITVTPYYVSHSAPDAYMFVIECDDKKVLHTGDFRDHGYKGIALLPMVNYYITRKNIDVLITEGTMLSRDDKRLTTESELQEQAASIMKAYDNVFVMCSSTDADRLASFFWANKNANPRRHFVVDGYQWKQLDKITNTLGQGDKRYQLKGALYYNRHKVEIIENIPQNGVTILVRNNHDFRKIINEVYPLMDPAKTCFVYSQFKGYILKTHKAFKQETFDFVHMKDWHIEYLPTSGHASREALADVCKKVNPRYAIIPIHRDAGTDFRSLDIPQDLKNKVIDKPTKKLVLANNLEIKIK